jgi:hypothetical protein
MPLPKTFGIDPDTRAWVNNLQQNGGAVSYRTVETVDNMVVSLKENGIWDNIVELGPICGDNVAAATTKIKYHASAGPYLGAISGGFTTGSYQERGIYGGLSGNGSACLNTFLVPARVGPGSNFSAFVCANNYRANNGAARFLGTRDNTSNNWIDMCDNSVNRFFQNGITAGINLTSGLFLTTRNGDTIFTYRNAASGNFAVASALGTVVQNNLYVFALCDTNGTAVNQYSGIMSMYGVGYGMTSGQAATLTTIVNTFQTELGRNTF